MGQAGGTPACTGTKASALIDTCMRTLKAGTTRFEQLKRRKRPTDGIRGGTSKTGSPDLGC
eukprot:5861355-Amphidinium_carterae.2